MDFSDSCTVTGVVNVVPNSSTTLWKNNNVELRSAKELVITANAPTQAHCGSEEHFTLNGVNVTGTISEGVENEKWFNAAIYYNCDAEHDENFDGTNGGDHSGCTMPDDTGTTSSTTSPEFHLNTGTAGTITASNSAENPLGMNVRVEGTATISGLTVASGKEIKVSDNQRASDVNIGANTVQVYDNANHGYSFTATTGTAHIHNQNVTNFSSVTLNGKNLGTPHVFGVSGSYQIFVGIASAEGLTFKVYKDNNGEWTELTAPTVTAVNAVGEASGENAVKLHISASTAQDATWFTSTDLVRLTVTVTSGGKVVFDPLPFKSTQP